VRYWIVFVEGINEQDQQIFLALTYCGKQIVWEYLLELIEEEYFLRNIKFNGYNQISEQDFNEIKHQ